MSTLLQPVATYLTYHQAVERYQALEEIGIYALVKSCGPPTFPFGEGRYFQLLIPEDNLATAQPVLALISETEAKNGQLPLACPACASPAVEPSRNLSWVKRVFYAGTFVYGCSNCGHSFFI
ncbi:hypothetical protein [Rufibacter sp. LB8]|uniref:hypothetical protein n=1 Tax=Rufibacter sp. LB8 TaxID=2777781 RepID=UPI00178C76DE|nr:hypothetical protein [Rufibacter sp. LB8]